MTQKQSFLAARIAPRSGLGAVIRFGALACLLAGSVCAGPGDGKGPPAPVLVEAESFADYGGWVHDQQFMDQMGSPFLLAHGLGRPVADARTTVRLPARGTYRVWVRTRDWVATWKAPGAPGRFRVTLNGKPLETVFGTEGAQWHWQDGGTVAVAAPDVELALHDLTGFEGRCDAILFASDATFVPPDDAPGPFRRRLLNIPEEPEPAGRFDLVVVGGGCAGMTAAIGAARLGLQVALIQDRPVLGGNSSSEVRVGLTGSGCKEPYPNVGNLTREISWSYRELHQGARLQGVSLEEVDERRQALTIMEKQLELFLNCRVNRVETDAAQRITAVRGENTLNGRRFRFAGRWFADCTGDGTVGFLAGADFDMTQLHMGRTNLWSPRDTRHPVTFPRCPWALDLTNKPFPGRSGKWQCPDPRFSHLGTWYWESGFEHDPIRNGEYIRDWNFRAMYGAWDCLKNVDRVLPNHELAAATHIAGLRESRRLLGDVVLTVQDLKSGREYADGCVPLTWRIDVHLPNHHFYTGFEGDAFISIAPQPNSHYRTPYWMPYRCLYSRNVSNLFMAGRDISVTHNALGAARVQWTTGMMGEIVAMATALCKQHATDPRGVYEHHLAELKALMDEGVGAKPPVRVLASEPFAVAGGRLDGKGSGTGWHSGWQATAGGGLQVATSGGSLEAPGWMPRRPAGSRVSTGSAAGVRVMDEPFSLAGNDRWYVSFLVRRNAEGAFRIESSNAKGQVRFGVAVAADGSAIGRGGTVESSSRPGLVAPGKTYLVVAKFVNNGPPTGAVTRVKLFEGDHAQAPRGERAIAWDVTSDGGATGVLQDRFTFAVTAGQVELDEFRLGNSWESAVGTGEP